MFNKLFKNKQVMKKLTYLFSFLTLVLVIILLAQGMKSSEFFSSVEDKTFDLRQALIANSGFKKPNKDIVILAIDDASYEYLLENYGEWPIPRDVYADVVNYIEKQDPKSIAFDLMFVKSLKSKHSADLALVDTMKRYKNVYTSMNLDDQPFDVRKPVELPKALAVNVKNDSNIDFAKYLTFKNCRTILPGILNNTPNVGMINVSRSTDGVIRKLPFFMSYQNNFYPHLALLMGLDSIDKSEKNQTKDFYIDKHSNVKIGSRSIPLDEDGGAILNWYGPAGSTFTEIPFYKVIKAMNGDKDAQKFDFKNKVIYIGTTAVSLYDTKSVPIGQIYPGVEIHATFVNNLIDNNFIKRVTSSVDVLVSLILALFVGFIVMRTSSTVVSVSTAIFTAIGYIVFAYLIMLFFNIWVAIVLPLTVILLVFIASYVIKYLMKSRDFEYQYRLATTDGLTELYNHRYFQEQMAMQVENCKRYDAHFSLILIDIDFFKKFNDTYGHQAGDAVLRQVAQALKKNVRATDIVCRYGGEEMSIILSNTDKEEAIITAQKICQAVAQKPFKFNAEQSGTVTISLGVATYPQDGEATSALIEYADKGLYTAKENGRNQVGL